jgi:hypothetical protein
MTQDCNSSNRQTRLNAKIDPDRSSVIDACGWYGAWFGDPQRVLGDRKKKALTPTVRFDKRQKS